MSILVNVFLWKKNCEWCAFKCNIMMVVNSSRRKRKSPAIQYGSEIVVDWSVCLFNCLFLMFEIEVGKEWGWWVKNSTWMGVNFNQKSREDDALGGYFVGMAAIHRRNLVGKVVKWWGSWCDHSMVLDDSTHH